MVLFQTKIKPEHLGSTFTIKFCRTEKRQFNLGTHVSSRIVKKGVFEQPIMIPDLLVKSDNICKICLEEVDDVRNKYIGPCGHALHMQCLFQYLESKKLLLPIPSSCIKCCNSHKYLPFECLYCNRVIFR